MPLFIIKKSLCLVFVLIFYYSAALSQKPPIDFLTYKNWTTLDQRPCISGNGKYVAYIIQSGNDSSTVILQSTNNIWKKELPGYARFIITEDSKFVVCSSATKDSVSVYEPESGKFTNIGKGSYFTLSPNSGNNRWVAFRSTYQPFSITIFDLVNKKSIQFPFATDYEFSQDGSMVVIKKESPFDSSRQTSHTLELVNLLNEKGKDIWSGTEQTMNFKFSPDSKKIAFFTGKIGMRSDSTAALWLYDFNKDSSSLLTDFSNSSFGDSLAIDNSSSILFNNEGDRIYFNLIPISRKKFIDPSAAKVTVWDYKDEYNPEETLNSISYRVGIKVPTLEIFRINTWREEHDEPENWQNKKFTLVHSFNNDAELNHELAPLGSSIYVVSLIDGTRKLVKSRQTGYSPIQLSPNSKYVIYYDPISQHYYSYSTETGIVKNITKGISTPLYDDELDEPRLPDAFGIGAWIKDEPAILLYDRYDIWKVDLNDEKPSENITSNYGRLHNTILRLINPHNQEERELVLSSKSNLLLLAFERKTKKNGFASLQLNSNRHITISTLTSDVWWIPRFTTASLVSFGFQPIQAKNADTYIVIKMNAALAPNLFETTNFIKFSQLSDIQPQKKFNWMTSELVQWKTIEGKQGQGILYKPENFDSSKKYPIIFHFYEKLSDGLNDFPDPGLMSSSLPIPYFVSNGYLVFVPDISYTIGKPGQSALKYIVSAAEKLKTFSWVNAKRMGLQGHSFGGYEVDYIISHCNLFVAAMSAAGAANCISGYNELEHGGICQQYLFEEQQYRIGATLWQKPNLYIENSPLFYAPKVKASLLMMDNKEDDSVPWYQGIAWYNALRRLNKKVWLLQYDGEGHILQSESNKFDLLQRTAQFFNYFLQDAKPPKWMTTTIKDISPTSERNNFGFQLDESGKKP